MFYNVIICKLKKKNRIFIILQFLVEKKENYMIYYVLICLIC
jgi:hypothetical protein